MLDDPMDLALIHAIEQGLPLVSRPYQAVAETLGLEEGQVVERLRRLLEQGVIKRLGVVVRHRELGYRANAMVVWDLPDERVAEAGRALGELPWVTLSYRRPRRPPYWPYNLFTMIHGRNRDEVLGNLASAIETCGLETVPRAVLFSGRRFKQCGARYRPAPAESFCEGDPPPCRAAGGDRR